MPDRSGLVDLLRDFFEAHEAARHVLEHYEEGRLAFEELRLLVGDDEDSVLYRLKERCHRLFRENEELPAHRGALVDLAIGSLFHEATKFRENFYQRETYGPRMRELRSGAGVESEALFAEFEKILEDVAARLDEGGQEAGALLGEAANELHLLLTSSPASGVVARFLVENAGRAAAVFGVPFDALLGEIHGTPAEGYVCAGRSYLDSGHYPSALGALGAALERGGNGEEITRWMAYARGMAAYLDRDYAESVAQLSRWADASDRDAPAFGRLARDALGRMRQLVEDAEGAPVVRDAESLLRRLDRADAAPPAGAAETSGT